MSSDMVDPMQDPWDEPAEVQNNDGASGQQEDADPQFEHLCDIPAIQQAEPFKGWDDSSLTGLPPTYTDTGFLRLTQDEIFEAFIKCHNVIHNGASLTILPGWSGSLHEEGSFHFVVQVDKSEPKRMITLSLDRKISQRSPDKPRDPLFEAVLERAAKITTYTEDTKDDIVTKILARAASLRLRTRVWNAGLHLPPDSFGSGVKLTKLWNFLKHPVNKCVDVDDGWYVFGIDDFRLFKNAKVNAFVLYAATDRKILRTAGYRSVRLEACLLYCSDEEVKQHVTDARLQEAATANGKFCKSFVMLEQFNESVASSVEALLSPYQQKQLAACSSIYKVEWAYIHPVDSEPYTATSETHPNLLRATAEQVFTPGADFIPDLKKLTPVLRDQSKADKRFLDDGTARLSRTSNPEQAVVILSQIKNDRAFGHHLLMPYHAQYVRSGGQGSDLGSRSLVSFTTAQFGYGAIHMNLRFYDPSDPKSQDSHMCELWISAKSVQAPTIVKLDVTAYEQFLKDAGLDHASQGAYTSASKISFSVDSKNFQMLWNHRTVQRLKRDFQTDALAALQHARDAVSGLTGQVCVEIVYPGAVPRAIRALGKLQTLAAQPPSPYAPLLTKVPRDGVFSSRSCMPDHDEVRFERPDEAVPVFASVDEWACRLGIALKDEYVYEQAMAKLGKIRPQNAYVLTIPNHTILNVDIAFVVCWPEPDKTAMPDIDEFFDIEFPSLAFEVPPLPAITKSDDEKRTDITRYMKNAASVAFNAYRSNFKEQRKIFATALEDVVLPFTNTRIRSEFVQYHSADLVRRRAKSKEEQHESSEQHEARIETWVVEFFDGHHILKTPFGSHRTLPWARACRILVPDVLKPIASMAAIIMAPAVRDLPKGTFPMPRYVLKFNAINPRDGTALAESVRKAAEDKSKLTRTIIIKQVHEGLTKAGISALYKTAKTESREYRRFADYVVTLREPGPGVNLASMFTGLPAFHEARQTYGPHAPQMAEILASFRALDSDQMKIFMDALSSLKSGLLLVSGVPGSGKSRTIRLLLLILLSGQVTFPDPSCEDPSGIQTDSTGEADLKPWEMEYNTPDEYEHAKKSTNFRPLRVAQNKDTPDHPIDPNPAAQQYNPDFFGHAVEESTYEEMLGVESDSEQEQTPDPVDEPVVEQPEQEAATVVPKAVKPPSDFKMGAPEISTWDLQEQDNAWAQQDETPDAVQPQRPVILIVAPSNKLLDKTAEDMHADATRLLLDLNVVRVHTPTTALRDFDIATRTDEARVDKDPMTETDMLSMEIELLHLEAMFSRTMKAQKRRGEIFSVAHRIYQCLQDPDSELVQRVADALANKKASEQDFRQNDGPKRLKADLKALIDQEYERADVLIGTPEAIAQLANRDLDIKVAAIWTDEGFRMTEPELFIPWSNWPQTLVRIVSGDDNQCGPIVKSQNTHKSKDKGTYFVAQFGSQLALSTARRLVRGGADTYYLNHNHRAVGGVSEFPSRQYYDGQMVEVQRDAQLSPEATRLRQMFGALTGGSESSAVGINMPGGDEHKAGHSYTNPSMIAVIVKLLALLYKDNLICARHPTQDADGELIDVLIVTKYKQQAEEINITLERLDRTWFPRNKVQAATVQAAQGDEARLVIMDETRDGDTPGYAGNAYLANTAVTRAKWGVISIYADKMWKGKSKLAASDPRVKNLAAYARHCEETGSVIRISKNLVTKLVEDSNKLQVVRARDTSAFTNGIVKACTVLPEKFWTIRDKAFPGMARQAFMALTPRAIQGLEDKTPKSDTSANETLIARAKRTVVPDAKGTAPDSTTLEVAQSNKPSAEEL